MGRSSADGALHHFTSVRTLSRKLAAASTFAEAAEAAVDTLQEIVQPNCATVANLEYGDAARLPIAIGPRASHVDLRFARTALEVNEPVSRLEAQSKIIVGLFERGVFRGNLIALWTEPRAVIRRDIEAMETISAMLELSAGRNLSA